MASQKFNTHSIAARKQRWRHHLKKIRQELSLERQQEASSHAYQQLIRKCKDARFILSFASFGSEISLWPLNQEWAIEGRLVLPLMLEEGKLQLFQVTDFQTLELHRWGMLEPRASICTPIDLSLIEIALIPGLGFDKETKYRLGYGKGCYDRLLDSPYSIHTWGVGFLEQAVIQLPYEKLDIPLEEVYLF